MSLNLTDTADTDEIIEDVADRFRDKLRTPSGSDISASYRSGYFQALTAVRDELRLRLKKAER